tara:strand:+ start:183 stop:464 length:282 start_codon:yes stop_codon:yes gene_type:complete
MDTNIKSAIDKLAMTLGAIISIHCFELNIIITIIISISVVLLVSKVYGQPIRDGIEQGVITKDELTKMLFRSPYPWAGGILVMASAIYQGMYS